MESIVLTEEHKQKLLEMCKALFPEYTAGDTHYGDIAFHHGYSSDQIIGQHLFFFEKDGGNDEYNNADLTFHWFEFCMTHLLQAVKAKLPINHQRQLIDDALMAYLRNGVHPVDYLYEQFLKLK